MKLVMIRNLFIIALLLCLVSCVKTKREFYPNGDLKLSYQVKKDKLHGTYKEYYRDGSLKGVATYENGELNGPKKVYYENGLLNWQANYENGKENGIFEKYSEEGVLLRYSYYKDGLQDSLTIAYYPNGEIKSESMFKNGLPHGEFKEYFEDGSLSFIAILENDTPVFYRRFTPDNQIEREYRHISIEFDADTIFLGEECKAEIRIFGPNLESVDAEIELLDRLEERRALKEKIVIKNNHYVVSLLPESSGRLFLNMNVFMGGYVYFYSAELNVLEK